MRLSRPSRIRRDLVTSRWVIWSLSLLVWTGMLCVPGSEIQRVTSDWEWTRRVIVAKTLHVAAYAYLAVLTGWLFVPLRYRWLMVFVLMAHATATETVQPFLGRTGMLTDVGLDQIGILLGLLISWKWWTRT